jgi:hypothetical protein
MHIDVAPVVERNCVRVLDELRAGRFRWPLDEILPQPAAAASG